MFLFKYKCINCKYNISLRVNFYYRLTFLLKFKNAVNTIVRYFMHIFSPPSLWAVVFSSFKLLQMTSQSLNTVYQIDFSVLFLTVLVFFVSCFTVSQYHGRHIIIIVSRSKCEYFVFSVFDMEACTFHDIILLILWDGWMVCTACYVKPCLSRLHGRDVFTTCPFWTIGPTCLLKQRYFSTGQTSCSSLYSMLYNTFFLKVVSKVRPAAYTMYNSQNWISFKRTDDRDTIYDGCNMIKGTPLSLIFKLRLCNLKAFLWSEY